MKKVILYIHGKGGSYLEAERYKKNCLGFDIIGIDYKDDFPWILDMMRWANVSEKDLCKKGEIHTDFGETLSWEYLCFVRDNPIKWNVPTEILYAEKDNLTSRQTVDLFIEHHNANLTIMENGEHWFHTDEQLSFLDKWMINVI